jgi:hypothetical protein
MSVYDDFSTIPGGQVHAAERSSTELKHASILIQELNFGCPEERLQRILRFPLI